MQPQEPPTRKDEVSPSAAPLPGPAFIVLHYVQMRIQHMEDLPSEGTGLYLDPATNSFVEFDLGSTPPSRVEPKVKEGRIYVLWGFRRSELDDLHPEWQKPQPPIHAPQD